MFTTLPMQFPVLHAFGHNANISDMFAAQDQNL